MAVELSRRGVLDHRRRSSAGASASSATSRSIAAIFPSIEGSADFESSSSTIPTPSSPCSASQGGESPPARASSTPSSSASCCRYSSSCSRSAPALARSPARRTPAASSSCSSYPVRRRNAVLAKGAAVAVRSLSSASSASQRSRRSSGHRRPRSRSLAHSRARSLGLAALGLLYGWLALAVGAAYPSKPLALGITGRLRRAAYLVCGLHALAGGSIRSASSRRSGSSARHRCRTASTAGDAGRRHRSGCRARRRRSARRAARPRSALILVPTSIEGRIAAP